MPQLSTHPNRSEILLLLRAAMVLYVFTVVIGILNGIDAVEFARRVLLAHLHVGTLGWITLSVFAAALWLFATPDDTGWRRALPRTMAPVAVVAVVVYNVAFLTTSGYLRPVAGTFAAAVILVFFAWTVAQSLRLEMSVPRWGLLAGLATSVTGGVLGVLWGVLIASAGDVRTLPEGGEGAHPATMVVGFLIPVSLALIEWWLRPDAAFVRGSRGGFIQMGLLFFGGFTLMLGVLLDALPLIMLNLPFSIAATVMFLVRNRRSLLAARWSTPASPFLVASAVAVTVNIGMIVYLISNYADDFESAPRRLFLALDHLMFVGVTTNAVFGLLFAGMLRARRSVASWADPVVFALVNVGMAGFWFGFVLDAVWLKRLFTPLMGVGILAGLAVFFARSLRPAEEHSFAENPTS